MVSVFGSPDRQLCAKLLMGTDLSFDAKIADVGCGTGLVSSYLAEEGYKNLYGFDPSEEMLKKAS